MENLRGVIMEMTAGLSQDGLAGLKAFTEQLIVEAKLDRSKLKDSDFGLPKLRKFPLVDKQHVQSAAGRFHFCPDNMKGELARNIMRAAKKHGVEIKNPDILKRA